MNSLNEVLTASSPQDVHNAYQTCVQQLLDERTEAGHWVGRLSTSALSTATAVSAISLYVKHAKNPVYPDQPLETLIVRGAQYLLSSQNSDGGWGDTDKSYSNIATTYLCWAALVLATDKSHRPIIGANDAIQAARRRIQDWGGIPALRQRYGTDKTFVVPILTNAALAGLVPWSEVAALPFEAAWVPQKFYRFLRLPVVSYAIPALVAIGQAKFYHQPPAAPLSWLRRLAVRPTMRVLLRIQPESGGYLEAAPLTSFVAMSLAATGRAEHPVTVHAIRFLIETVLEDGSWPIDTNLATWVTSLSVNALSVDALPVDVSSARNVLPAGDATVSQAIGQPGEETEVPGSRSWIMPTEGWQWLLDCQYQQPHPFTGADPGAWGWTNLSGSVPDADDTPGALLALFVARRLSAAGQLRFSLEELDGRAAAAVRWLLDLQNSDGGWPTFCRGWGRLPFDRSGVDLTAHAVRALVAWYPMLDAELRIRIDKALLRGWRYIVGQQRPDGTWLPLWFGNQDNTDDENPVYGTAKTLVGIGQLIQHFQRQGLGEIYRSGQAPLLEAMKISQERAVTGLLALQNEDGGWGGGSSVQNHVARHWRQSYVSSIEETALAVESIADGLKQKILCQTVTNRGKQHSGFNDEVQGGEFFQKAKTASARGVSFLCQRIEAGQHRNSWPIGFYFAKLWYHEELYPLIFSVAALGKWRALEEFAPNRLKQPASRTL